MRPTLPLLFCLLSSGCATVSVTQGTLSKSLVTECVAHCASLDMKLTAMVIIKTSAGCVCEPKDSQARAMSSAAAVAGETMIADEEKEQQIQQQRAASGH